jgi:HK97 family phage portal protein
MPIVSSFGALKAMTPPEPTWRSGANGSLPLYGLSQTYYKLYETQPNVRICVDFLARNLAELNRPVYRRVSDTDRVRLNGHDLAVWLKNPNPATTRYRLFEDLVTDLGIYYRAYWMKVRYKSGAGRGAIGLVRLPPEEMSTEGGLLPSQFYWTTTDGRTKEFAPSEIVHFCGYRLGISPLETLRRILAEEQAAGQYRESLWSHGAKHEGIWERDAAAQNHTPTQINDWRAQWQEFASSSKAGQTAVGERGWKYKQTSFSSKDSEYILGGKLRREVCAAQYHIPQPLVGILEHATFSNIKEQHKHLYQDTLGPWNEMIDQEIERQLLVECDDQTDVYIEANIDAKLAGTPEERAISMQVSIGRPWRTVNEGRALDNLPRKDDPSCDEIAPQQGGPSDATAQPKKAQAQPTDDPTAALAPIVRAHRKRQDARLLKLPADDRAEAFAQDLARWNQELAADIAPLVGAAQAWQIAAKVNADRVVELEDAADDAIAEEVVHAAR